MDVKRFFVWVVLTWAIVSGCFVTDLWVCPWTAVFDRPQNAKEASP